MAHSFEPGRMYRMPVGFGPAMGPRQGPGGRKFSCVDDPKVTSISVSFVSDPGQLAALLPPGFELAGDPVVTVRASYMTEIEWLAGRGYNTLGVTFPARYRGRTETVQGPFLAVLWENLTDPILTGREELGFAKIYCELPEPDIGRSTAACTAAWLGFNFMEMSVAGLKRASGEPDAGAGPADGVLHCKYMPRTGEWGTPDSCYAVLTPAETPNRRVVEHWTGSGRVEWTRARWEDLPTQYNIVNALADLEVRQYAGASLMKTVGGKDLSDQRIVR